MSKDGEDTVEDTEDTTTTEGGDANEGANEILKALQDVLKKALVNDGLARGLHESVKVLDRRQAHLCVLAANCNEPAYTRLVEALCAEHGTHLIKVPDSKLLGEWAGLCVRDKEGKARKVVGCSCVVVKDYGAHSESLTTLLDYFKKN